MLYQNLLAAIALAAAPWAPPAGAQVFDYGKYPDLRGQWVRYGPSGPDLKGPLVRLGPSGVYRTRFDPTKPPAAAQQAGSATRRALSRRQVPPSQTGASAVHEPRHVLEPDRRADSRSEHRGEDDAK